MDLATFYTNYWNACELNNLGIQLLEKGNFQVAHDMLRSSLAIFQTACRARDAGHIAHESQLYENARQEAQGRLYQETVLHSRCHIEVIVENQSGLPSSLFQTNLTNLDHFEAYPFVFSMNFQNRHHVYSSQFDFHCTAALYNFALAKLCLYFVTGGDKLIMRGIQLWRMALNQFSRIISSNEECTSDVSLSEESNDDTNIPALCILLLSNLARALPLISELDEAQEMQNRLSMIASSLYVLEEHDQGNPFCATAAAAA